MGETARQAMIRSPLVGNGSTSLSHLPIGPGMRGSLSGDPDRFRLRRLGADRRFYIVSAVRHHQSCGLYRGEQQGLLVREQHRDKPMNSLDRSTTGRVLRFVPEVPSASPAGCTPARAKWSPNLS